MVSGSMMSCGVMPPPAWAYSRRRDASRLRADRDAMFLWYLKTVGSRYSASSHSSSMANAGVGRLSRSNLMKSSGRSGG